jgi:transcriptional regulator with XRE-family HTH domain
MTTDNAETFGQFVRRQRHLRAWTLATLAKRIGISVPYLSDIERDRSSPSVETMTRILAALGLVWNWDAITGRRNFEVCYPSYVRTEVEAKDYRDAAGIFRATYNRVPGQVDGLPVAGICENTGEIVFCHDDFTIDEDGIIVLNERREPEQEKEATDAL